MRLQKKFNFLVFPILLLTVVNSWAAGLGGIDLDSFLGQPLTARIQLLGVPADQVSTVSARLASAGDYQIMGLDQSKLSVPLTFTPAVWRGKAVIEVRSVSAIKDPILQFAIDVSWQHGHLLREYTLFLDPPTVAVAPPRKASPVKAANTSSSIYAVEDTQPPTTSDVVKRPAVQTIISRGSQSQSGEYGPVRSGETLWSIAHNWSKQAGVSVNQAMVAIVRLNPEDFVKGDINRMNRGAILRLPTAEDIANISAQEANAIVNQQIAAWREQTTQTTAPPTLSAVAEETQAETPRLTPKQAAAEQPVEINDGALARIVDDRLEQALPAEDFGTDNADDLFNDVVSDDAEADSGGLLELVPPADAELAELDRQLPGSAAGNDRRDTVATIKLENRFAVTEEDLVATQEQNAVLQAQVSKMQTEIAALRDGLNLNDNELAAMQQQITSTAAGTDAQTSNRELESSKGTKMLKTDDKSLLERWWWLGLLVLLAAIGFLVYRNRNNVSTESQAEINFLDNIHESEQARKFKDADKADDEGLAAEAEKILEVLEQGDAEAVEEQEQLNQAAKADTEKTSRNEASQAKAEAAEVRKFLEKVEVDKAALAESSEDALDHTETPPAVEQQQGENDTGNSAENEVLESLESDDDSDSEQARDNSTEEQIEIKLDLARAYLAMDDKPAARTILDEIMRLGSEQQQLEARGMLDEIE
ncbi:MAG: hypothetical protein L3J24_10570 [Xanthomonadales bacterium]|nr:hypothetical protein [Xanthomonadales bacterium]